ncbi:DsbA family protein [Actinomadura algeriensis]|uniref:Protein-disulfide isomerase n=1 Tax=Actinomadura algeriensis TaxID=1679523 RepID=A0ABR9JX41_9ACTN|nr:thioredoxin domain-containing protein [Actinomadura algeriensis]MBE1535122.1 protein-disulfide isomerase [Actinomadura algeriensis]
MGYPPNPPNPPFPPPPPGGAPPLGGPPPPGGAPWPPGPPGPPPPRGGGGKVGLILAIVGGGLVIVLVLVVGIAAMLVNDDDGGGGGSRGGEVQLQVGDIVGGAKATPRQDGGLAMARPGVSSPVVDIYTDFACPHCGTFDKANDPMLKELAVNGDAEVVFHPMVIFDETREPAYGNALRAASALRCVGNGARWLSYQDALYEHQPASLQTKGYDLRELVRIGAEADVADARFEECVLDQWYADDVARVSREYIDGGVSGTPTVRVNDTALGQEEIATPEALRRAIEAAS